MYLINLCCPYSFKLLPFFTLDSLRDHPFSTYAKVFKKTISIPPDTHTCTCAYQGVRNVSCVGTK